MGIEKQTSMMPANTGNSSIVGRDGQPPAVPQMPGFLQAYLTGLAAHQAQAVYEWVVSAGPSNYVSLAIQDATQSKGNDNYGDGV